MVEVLHKTDVTDVICSLGPNLVEGDNESVLINTATRQKDVVTQLHEELGVAYTDGHYVELLFGLTLAVTVIATSSRLSILILFVEEYFTMHI